MDIKIVILCTGAISMAYLVAFLFFLRFWKTTGDMFFLFFAISFFMEGVNRAIAGYTGAMFENTPVIYIIRLISYLLIIIAFVTKNLPSRKSG